MSSLHEPLLRWYDANKRDLPWRQTSDPYAIWVSEIMLQQTQVVTVIPYFERWMARFPTISSLALADEQEVLSMWQGLGYYRRAKLLHKGAQDLQSRNRRIEESEIELPRSAKELLAVSGIGPYTAGAIASIAFNEAVALVDGNVERVFARLTVFGDSGAALNSGAWKWATENIHPTKPGDWNQALMELGATICRPIDPECGTCPLNSLCEGLRTGVQRELPKQVRPPKTVALVHHIWIPVWGDRFGVRQIAADEWWAGMWEFPRNAEIGQLEGMFPEAAPEKAGSFKHSVTHHRIQVHVSRVRVESPLEGLRWLSAEELCEIPMPAPQRRALRLVVMPPGEKGTTLLESTIK